MKFKDSISKKEILGLAIGITAILASFWFMFTPKNVNPEQITITPGPLHTTRAEVAYVFAHELQKEGIKTEVVATKNAIDNLNALQSGRVSFAMASGILNLGHYGHIRETTPLYNEALHLLVKNEYAKAVTQSLSNLRNHSVNLGVHESAGALLAESVLAYAGLSPTLTTDATGYHPIYQDPTEIESALTATERSALPDAIIEFSSIPSKIAKTYIIKADYQLVGVTFADAFRLADMFNINESTDQNTLSLNSRYTIDVTIPAYTYRTDPPVPSVAIHTIGAPLMLLSRDSVSPETVQTVLKSVFESRFARIMEPIISPNLLDLPPRVKLHEGTINYRNRDRPLIGKDDIDELSSTLSAVGALVGGLLFLWQIYRQHRQSSREQLLGEFMKRIAEIEHNINEIELSDEFLADKLVEQQKRLLSLKAEALTDYNEGRLVNNIALMDILMPINAVRNDIGKLLLHRSSTEN